MNALGMDNMEFYRIDHVKPLDFVHEQRISAGSTFCEGMESELG